MMMNQHFFLCILNLYKYIEINKIYISFKNMDKSQQVDFTNKTRQFIEDNKLRQLFYTLTKHLAEVQPKDPIQYLIQHLETSKAKRLIYLQGFHNPSRNQIASVITNKFNFKLINLNDLLKVKDVGTISDEKVNTSVKQAINKVDSVYKGILISGYPNNISQANFLQKNGLLPERIFILPYKQSDMERYYDLQGHNTQTIEKLITRDKLNLKQIKQILHEIPDYLTQATENSIQTISSTLKLRDRKKILPESPRILVLHPPYMQPTVVASISKKYCIQHISLERAFLKLKNKKQDYEKYVRKHEHLSNQLQLALIETECTSVLAKRKGFILSGWPRDLNKYVHMKEHYLIPHIILAFFDDREKLVTRFETLDNSNHMIFPVKDKPSAQEFRKQLQDYEKLVHEVKSNEKSITFSLRDTDQQVLRSLEIALTKTLIK